jgi:hypothetical protein
MGTDRSRVEWETSGVAHRASAYESVQLASDARAVGSSSQSNDVMYVIAAATDVAATWRRHGWIPPSELPEYHEKWARAQDPTPLMRVGK